MISPTVLVAKHLQVKPTDIIKIEKWYSVLFVVGKKIGAKFVSKKVLEVNKVSPTKTTNNIVNYKIKYKFLGSTDSVTVCDHCGKQHLNKTMVLGVVDGAGNVDIENPVFFGSTCGYYALLDNKQHKEAENARLNMHRKYIKYDYLSFDVFRNKAQFHITLGNGAIYGYGLYFYDDNNELYSCNRPDSYILHYILPQIDDLNIRELLKNYILENN